MMDRGDPFTLVAVKKDGSLLEVSKDNPAVSLSYDFYKGLRTLKFIRSGAKRTIRDSMIIAINDFDVFL